MSPRATLVSAVRRRVSAVAARGADRAHPAPRVRRPYLPALVACTGAFLAASYAARAGERQTYIGVLEDVPGAYVGESRHHRVRVVFRASGNHWTPLPHNCSTPSCLGSITAEYPARLRWTLWYQGRPLGVLTAHTPSAYPDYASIGRQVLDPGQSIPRVGKPSGLYAGYLENRPVQRPLIATAGPLRLAPSPVHWSARVGDPAALRELAPEFSHLVPRIDDCRVNAQGEPIPSNGRAPRLADLRIAGEWENRSGAAIVDVEVRDRVYKNCDGPAYFLTGYWFYRASGQAWRPLPGQPSEIISMSHLGIYSGNQLAMPLEFLEVRGTGRDLVLFLMAGDDAGGYALFYDHFRKVAEFTWNYH